MPDQARPLPERDLTWHRTQAALMDQPGLDKALRGRIKRGDYRAAIVYLDRMMAIAPDPATALTQAQMQMRCRAYSDALRQLQDALESWPEDLPLRRIQAEIAMLAKDYPFAEQAWEILLDQHRVQGPYAILRRLACLRLRGQHDAAQAFLGMQADRLRKHMARAGLQMLRKPRTTLPAGLYLVCGNNGTGKSTLGHFLQAMGYAIIDADTEIASFCLGRRFSDVRYDLLRAFPQGEADIRWFWPETRARACFTAARRQKAAVFVIGGFGATVAPYRDAFRQVFHLSAPDHVIADRLAARNSIGHKPGSSGFNAALRRNAREQRPDFDAIILSADRPTWAICADLLAAIEEERPLKEKLLQAT